MNSDCYKKKQVSVDSCKNMMALEPRVERRDKDFATISWDKKSGAQLYSILTKAHGKWRRLAVTRSNFYKIQVSDKVNTHLQVGYRTKCGNSKMSKTLDLREQKEEVVPEVPEQKPVQKIDSTPTRTIKPKFIKKKV